MENFDLPLEELSGYQGMSPRPNDFETFWASSVSEAELLQLDIKIEAADFRLPYAECFDIWYSGTLGARIHAKCVRPNQTKVDPTPAILQYHGLGWYSGDWADMLPFVSLGYSVFAMECRGQGGLSQDIGYTFGPTLYGHLVTGIHGQREDLMYRNIMLDAYLLLKVAKSVASLDADRIGMMGESQGGGLAIAAAALSKSVSKLAVKYPYLSDYKRVWQMGLDQNAYSGLREYFRHFDFHHEHEDAFFNQLGYIDVQNFAQLIDADVLFASALSDRICPPSTQFAIYNKLNCTKEMRLYHDYGHEVLPGWNDRVFQFMAELI
jgi:cephalosporin-C deacetylase